MQRGKLKIAMVSFHSCIRVLKETLALKELGHEVYLITEKVPYAYDEYTGVSIYVSKEHLQRTVKMHAQFVDVFHVHNEPDHLVWQTKEAAGNIPVIYDVHDLDHLRWKKKVMEPKDYEVKAFNAADGVVHVSVPCRNAAWEHHERKPDCIIYSMQNRRFTARDEDILPEPAWKSVCYEGGIDSEMAPTKVEGTTNQVKFNIRNWIPNVKRLRDMGFSVTIYGANPLKNFAYEELGAVVHRLLIYPAMLSALRPHGFGLVGCPLSTPLMEYAMPNKLFEYMSAGVVPIVVNAKEAAQFVAEHGVGLVLPGNFDNWTKETIADFILAEGPKTRERLLGKRKSFTMEGQIKDLEELYYKLV